jgi:hypothetical protein
MPLTQDSIRPMDGAIIGYCCAFFGRAITLSWQDLPAHNRGSRDVLLNLKDYFLAALTNDFLGGVSALDEISFAKYWGQYEQTCGRLLKSLDSALKSQCTSPCAQFLAHVQQRLRATSSYNQSAFDPKSLVAYLISAALNSRLEFAVGSELGHAFVRRLGGSMAIFYATLADVLDGYLPGAELASTVENAQMPTANCYELPTANRYELPAHSSIATDVAQLTGYIQRFYKANLYSDSSHPNLTDLFQNIYATLLCYVRDSSEKMTKKTDLLRQVLQSLYSLTEIESEIFDRKLGIFERVAIRLNEPEPYLAKTLIYICEEISVFKRNIIGITGTSSRAFEEDFNDGWNSGLLKGSLYKIDSDGLALHEYFSGHKIADQAGEDSDDRFDKHIRTANIFQCVEYKIEATKENEPSLEVSNFIDRYWRNVMLVAGLDHGLESENWKSALKILHSISSVSSMTQVDVEYQNTIVEFMRSIGRFYLSYGDFLEREEYLQPIQGMSDFK